MSATTVLAEALHELHMNHGRSENHKQDRHDADDLLLSLAGRGYVLLPHSDALQDGFANQSATTAMVIDGKPKTQAGRRLARWLELMQGPGASQPIVPLDGYDVCEIEDQAVALTRAALSDPAVRVP